MKKLILPVVITILSGCTQVEKNEQLLEENVSAVAADYAFAYENASPLQLFFKEDHTKAIFRTEGSDDTFFSEETLWLSDSYVKTLVEKEGHTQYSIYRITENVVEVIYEGATELNASLEELEKMIPKEIFFSLPLRVDTSFSDWIITDVDQTVETPFETFHQVVEITKTNNQETIRKYFAPGFGLVKETLQVKTEDPSSETIILLDNLEYR